MQGGAMHEENIEAGVRLSITLPSPMERRLSRTSFQTGMRLSQTIAFIVQAHFEREDLEERRISAGQRR
jgi:macrodomain Ter protein organizer (MatP/YcbG family)